MTLRTVSWTLLCTLPASLASAAAAAPVPTCPLHAGHAAVAEAAPAPPLGESAFAAVASTVAALDQAPETDWGRVHLLDLALHLRDMHRVMLDTEVVETPVEGGVAIEVRAEGPTLAALRRMVPAHAAMMAAAGEELAVEERADGYRLVWVGDAAGAARRRGLGFFGLLTVGGHHAAHHAAMARGVDPHRQAG